MRSRPSRRRPSKNPGTSHEAGQVADPSPDDLHPDDLHPDDLHAEELHAEELSAELATAYWAAYRERMAAIGFGAMARQFAGLVAQAVRLG
jgi:hypothetical protein